MRKGPVNKIDGIVGDSTEYGFEEINSMMMLGLLHIQTQICKPMSFSCSRSLGTMKSCLSN